MMVTMTKRLQLRRLVNVPTLEELKRDLQILEVETEYDRMGRIKLTGNRPVSIKITKEMLEGTNDDNRKSSKQLL